MDFDSTIPRFESWRPSQIAIADLGKRIAALGPGERLTLIELAWDEDEIGFADFTIVRNTCRAILGTLTLSVSHTDIYGTRMDPFLRRPAMHTGLDMRGDTGEPVHATAAGKVTIAGREGGYGNLVEIATYP